MVCASCGTEKQAWHADVMGNCVACHNEESKYSVLNLSLTVIIVIGVLSIGAISLIGMFSFISI
jgi:hypothetical protein